MNHSFAETNLLQGSLKTDAEMLFIKATLPEGEWFYLKVSMSLKKQNEHYTEIITPVFFFILYITPFTLHWI